MRQISAKAKVKDLFKKAGFQPLKGLGQNFLIDKSVLKKVIGAADLRLKDIVLEIGPGLGILTQELARRVKKVIAIEKDQKMVEALKDALEGFKNVKIIQGDILKISISSYELQAKNYKLVANLPYYITSPVIRKFLENDKPPKEIVLMVQKEVAQRICAVPPNMSLLAVSVQFYAKAKIISYVSKESFWPRPKVGSAIIKISQIRINLPRINTNLFFKIVKTGFSQPRKQILNNLSKGLKLDKDLVRYWLSKNNIQPEQRAETLNINDWINLTKTHNAEPLPGVDINCDF